MSDEGLGTKLLKGSAWMLGMRWSMRFIGLLSMSVVARLLTPDDFGIFAVAVTMIGLLDALTDIGADTSIIRHTNPQRQHYDTVWTLKIAINSSMALLIALCAPLSSYIYADTRYKAVLYVMALSILMNGFANIGIADFRRNLQFQKDFQYNLLVQVVGATTTIAAAVLLRSYWALVLGGLARSVAGVLLSFVMHSYRPRLSLAAWKEMFGFSFWIMVRSLAIFLSGRGDRLVVGAFYSPTVVGWYAIAGDLAQMAVFELLHPIGRALLPSLAAKQEDKEWERRNLQKIFNGTATIAAAMGLGLAALAEPVMTLIYGANFTAAAPLLSLLALASAIDGFSQPVGQYLVVHGKTKELALLFVLGGVLSVGAAYVLAMHGVDIQIIGYARLAVSFFSLVRVFYLVRTLQSMHWQDIIVAWIRPLIAGVVMYAVLWGLQEILSVYHIASLITELGMPLLWGEDIHRLMMLSLGVPLGVLVYCGILIGIWYLMGRPLGIEEEIMQRVFK
jgi:O-antigen/teichoic acid export membrane protein